MYASARKIPHLRITLFLVLGIWGNLRAQAPDSTEIFKRARAAEAEYERAARRLAPFGTSGRSGTCDEYVGRFCLYYDTGRDRLPAEPPEISRIRARAIERLNDAFSLNRARTATAFPLIRLLLEGRRPRDAREVAREFSTASPDSITSRMLMALTAHANGDIPGAEEAIENWLQAVDSAERRRLEDLRFLLDSREEKRYRALARDSVGAYERRFWRYADALYLTPGNETRTEHFARHAESRLVQVAPSVLGSTSWGSDVAELTIRFGTPKARTRQWPGGMGTTDLQITEHWDPDQLIYAPPMIDSALIQRARPHGGWPLDTIRSISGHAPSTIRRMIPLEHQASVFPSAAGPVLRIDGQVISDSAATGQRRYRRGLFLMDSRLGPVQELTDSAATTSDTLRFSFEVQLPATASFYSAEILELETRLAARARYAIERPGGAAGLQLSDILVTEPFAPGHLPSGRNHPGLSAKSSLVLPATQPFGVYAEATLGSAAPDSARVELEMIALDGSPAAVRVARWIGERLGLRDRPPPQRLTWSVEIADSTPTPVALTVDPGNLKPGRYFIEIAVSNQGRRTVARREVLFSASETN